MLPGETTTSPACNAVKLECTFLCFRSFSFPAFPSAFLEKPLFEAGKGVRGNWYKIAMTLLFFFGRGKRGGIPNDEVGSINWHHF